MIRANELCFFLISVSYKLAWTAISSLLSQFSRNYGPEVLLQINIAYFFPSIPVLCLQTAFNDAMDRRLGLPAAAMTRFTVGLGALALLTSFFPILASSHKGLILTTVLVGMSYGLAFGTSYQLASKFSPASTVALTTGFVSSGPVVLMLDLFLKRGTFYDAQGLSKLFSWVAMITCLGLAAACWVVMSNRALLRQGSHGHHVELRLPSKGTWGGASSATRKPGVLRRGGHMDSQGDPSLRSSGSDGGGYIGGGGHTVDLESMESGETPVEANHNHSQSNVSVEGPYYSGGAAALRISSGWMRNPSSLYEPEDKEYKRDLPLRVLAWRVSPAALCIFLSVGTSMLVFPFFTYVHSTGLLGERLPQVLFYVRLVGDIMGRMVPSGLLVSTAPKLMLWGILKTAMLPLIFLSILRPHVCLGDVGSLMLIGIFWGLSGYLNTCAYLLAPKLVPANQKARASGIMTVAFQVSCFTALMLAAVIQQWFTTEHAV